MTEIAPSSVLAISVISPAAIFSYLGIEKYGQKLHFSRNKSSIEFDLNLQRSALERCNSGVKHKDNLSLVLHQNNVYGIKLNAKEQDQITPFIKTLKIMNL